MFWKYDEEKDDVVPMSKSPEAGLKAGLKAGLEVGLKTRSETKPESRSLLGSVDKTSINSSVSSKSADVGPRPMPGSPGPIVENGHVNIAIDENECNERVWDPSLGMAGDWGTCKSVLYDDQRCTAHKPKQINIDVSALSGDMFIDDEFTSSDESGAGERFTARIDGFKKENKPIYKHHVWWVIHNCIAHPLIGVFPSKKTFHFHDWTSRKINGK